MSTDDINRFVGRVRLPFDWIVAVLAFLSTTAIAAAIAITPFTNYDLPPISAWMWVASMVNAALFTNAANNIKRYS
jgi:hypothetical protein